MRRHSLNHPRGMSAKMAANGIRTHARTRGMSAKMAANGIRTHARTNQRRTLASRSRQSLNAGLL